MKSRRDQARAVRIDAAELAHDRHHPVHQANGDERRIPRHAANYTKGLPHCPETGLLLEVPKRDIFEEFVRGIDSGNPVDFKATPLGPHRLVTKTDPGPNAKPLAEPRIEEDFCEVNGWNWKSTIAGKGSVGVEVRAWESASAGNAFDLEGPDAHAVTMPPAPAVGSEELTAEMGEVYSQALLRDVPFKAMRCLGETAVDDEYSSSEAYGRHKATLEECIGRLNRLAWFRESNDCGGLTASEKGRKRGPFRLQTVFRGIAPGDDVGPYISQFLLMGNRPLGTPLDPPWAGSAPEAAGYIQYGSLRIDQRVRVVAKEDYMTTWAEWLDVQDGADLRGKERYETAKDGAFRFIATPRDLATYVHYDALYEAYLNACLILLARQTPFDPGIPYQGLDHRDHQQGFAHFGGPHILSLLTEVATRALKAVRFQKFNVHRRLRPEALAARIYKAPDLGEGCFFRPFVEMSKRLKEITTAIRVHNEGTIPHTPTDEGCGTSLLPMAFPEGSPMHPAYGAGHATVAGACVTILKAYFDHGSALTVEGRADKAYVASDCGSTLELVDVLTADCSERACLTVEGELNKLAANISIGRDWAGVHYFSDYWESLLMGEQVALGILEEQKLTYGETFSMTVPLFGGGSVRI